MGCEVEVTDVCVTQYLVKMSVLIIVYFVEESFIQLFGSGVPQIFLKNVAKTSKF